jgi:hypothetical protein
MKAKVNCDQRALFLLRPLLNVSPKLLGRADEVTGTRAALSMRLLTERSCPLLADCVEKVFGCAGLRSLIQSLRED